MLESGALDEARALGARGLDPMLPAMKAHGMPWFAAHFRGQISLDRAAELARRDTRRYAKRQSTWTNNQLASWPRLAHPGPGERVLAATSVIQG